MAVTYYADSFNQNIPFGSMSSGNVFAIPFRFTLTVAFGLNDIVNLTPIPGGASVVGYEIYVPQLDSAGGPAITIDVGDSGAGNSQIYQAAATVGRSSLGGILAHSGNNDGNAVATVQPIWGVLPIHYVFATPLNLLLFQFKIHAAPTTGTTTGKIKGWLYAQPDGVAPLV